MRTDVRIHTADGMCAATLHTAPGDGSHPGVILYADAGGVRETFAAMADRLAGFGYAVLLPDVYYRTPLRRSTSPPCSTTRSSGTGSPHSRTA